MVRLHIQPRATDFANNIYYVFHNAMSVNNSLSSGVGQSTKGVINMETAGTYSSSENWQLYYQQGRYFIRNYDYGGQWQLGLTEDSLVIPKLMKRSGALGQQWTMERQDDGTYKFHNGLLGNTSSLALAKGNKQPAMQSAESGSKWEITPNPSALAPKDTTMMLDNNDFEIPKVSSSSTAISSTQTQTATQTQTTLSSVTSTTASQTSNTNLASNSSPTNSATAAPKSSSLSPGAIAGVAIGIVLIIALLAGIGYFLWARRKPKAPLPPTAELGDTNKAYYQYAHMGQPQNASGYAPYGAPVQLDSPPVMHELEHRPVGKGASVGVQRLG